MKRKIRLKSALGALLIPVGLFAATETNAQACNPQYPATCVQVFNPYQRSYQPPALRLYVPPPPPPQYWPHPPPSLGGTTIYTDQYGNRLGYGHQFGGTTTYTDQYGNTLGYGRGSGGTTTYTDQYGNLLGREQKF